MCLDVGHGDIIVEEMVEKHYNSLEGEGEEEAVYGIPWMNKARW